MIGRWPFHPILLALFPILSLYRENRRFISADDLAAPLAIAAAVAAVSWLVLGLATRSPRRAGQTVSVLVVLYFGLGLAPLMLSSALTWVSTLWVVQPVQVPDLPVAVVLAAAAGWLIWRIWRQADPKRVDAPLNLMSAALVLLPGLHLATLELEKGEDPTFRHEPLFQPTASTPRGRPDIYYIVLDAYARADVLRDLFGLDNTPFLDALRDRGFAVAERASSNYCQTPLSIASSINARYLAESDSSADGDRKHLRQLISGGSVSRTLRGLGYQYLAFDTGFDLTNCEIDADDFRSPLPGHRPFHDHLMQVSPIRWLRAPTDFGTPHDLARTRINFTLDNLATVARDRRPAFVFAHVVSPHPPFIFHADGSPYESPSTFYTLADGDLYDAEWTDESYVEGYRAQLTYLNRRLLETIDAIKAASPEPPVIILQSDHGSGLQYALDSLERTNVRERFGNLIAIDWPGDGAPPGFRDDLSAVNVFRVVLDGLFDAGLPQLPDHSYYSTSIQPFIYVEVTERVRPRSGRLPAPVKLGD